MDRSGVVPVKEARNGAIEQVPKVRPGAVDPASRVRFVGFSGSNEGSHATNRSGTGVAVAGGLCHHAERKVPGRDELTKLTASSRPARLADSRTVEVDRWDMNGPLPEAIDSVPPRRHPVAGLLEQAAARRSGPLMVSESMHCVAHQLGSFYLLHGGSPSRSLQNFIQARWRGRRLVERQLGPRRGAGRARRCGALRAVEGQRGEDDLLVVGGGASMAGIWFGRKDGKAVAMLAQAGRDALVDRVALRPAEGGKVVISGELTNPAESIDASVTRGRFGFEVCQRDASVPLPAPPTCPTSAEDPSAWIEVAAFPAGRVLGDVVLRMLALPSGAANKAWVRPDYGLHSERAATAAELTRLVNRCGPTPGSSRWRWPRPRAPPRPSWRPTSRRATATSPPRWATRWCSGSEAGWDIHGTVRHSWFASASMLGGLDPASLLTAALEMPSGREALLRADARQLAVGPVKEEGEHPSSAASSPATRSSRTGPPTELVGAAEIPGGPRGAQGEHAGGRPSLRQVMEGPRGRCRRHHDAQAGHERHGAGGRLPRIPACRFASGSTRSRRSTTSSSRASWPPCRPPSWNLHRPPPQRDEAWGTYVIFFLALVPTSA